MPSEQVIHVQPLGAAGLGEQSPLWASMIPILTDDYIVTDDLFSMICQ